jgi:hypothetical protein
MQEDVHWLHHVPHMQALVSLHLSSYPTKNYTIQRDLICPYWKAESALCVPDMRGLFQGVANLKSPFLTGRSDLRFHNHTGHSATDEREGYIKSWLPMHAQ